MNLPIIYHPNYVAPIPSGHRFPMAKFKLLYEMLLADEVTNKSHFFQSTTSSFRMDRIST